MNDECIWIADSNLFHSAYNRRFLFGVSAWTGRALGLIPAPLEGSEVSAQIAYGLAGKRHQGNNALMDFYGEKTARRVNAEVELGETPKRRGPSPDEISEAKRAIPPDSPSLDGTPSP